MREWTSVAAIVIIVSSLQATGSHRLSGSGIEAHSGPRPGYYESAIGLTGNSLRIALHGIVDDHGGSKSYVVARETAKDIEEDVANPYQVITVWRNSSVPKDGPKDPIWMLTHMWPTLYGYSSQADGHSVAAYSDLNGLFAATIGYTIDRDDLPYDTCVGQCIELPVNGHPQTSNWFAGEGSDGFFQVWPGRRGDIARATFYMDVRYAGGIDSKGDPEPDLILTDDRDLIAEFEGRTDTGYMGILSTLIRWHLEDPVDDYERRRNDIIFEAQDNRNPFIDHPEWVCSIWDHPDCPPPTATPDPSPTASATHTPSPTLTPTAMPTATPTPAEAHILFLPHGLLIRD